MRFVFLGPELCSSRFLQIPPRDGHPNGWQLPAPIADFHRQVTRHAWRTSKVGVANLPHPPQGKSRDIAAEAVSMKTRTHEKLKKVVKTGDRDVIDQMDSGELSIHKAHEAVKIKVPPQRITITLSNKQEETAEWIAIKRDAE